MKGSEDHITVAKVTSLDMSSNLNDSKKKSKGFFSPGEVTSIGKENKPEETVFGRTGFITQLTGKCRKARGGGTLLPRQPRVPVADGRTGRGGGCHCRGKGRGTKFKAAN